MGTQKNVFEIYRQFGHASSKRFASPGLGNGLIDLGIAIQFLLGTRDFLVLHTVQL